MNVELPEKIKKRDGSIVKFKIEKIESVLKKALLSENAYDEKTIEMILNKSISMISKVYQEKKPIPTVEEIQDIIEVIMMKNGLFEIAKSFILYREKKNVEREEKKKILQVEKLTPLEKRFSLNALKLLSLRYLAKDEDGKINESIKELFIRVSVAGTLSELLYDDKVFSKEKNCEKSDLDINSYIENSHQYDNVFKIGKYNINHFHFEQLMKAFKRLKKKGYIKISSKEFISLLETDYFNKYYEFAKRAYKDFTSLKCLINTPALINSGRKLGMLSACFTLDVNDNIESIMKLCHDVVLIQKAGGGTGMNFSKLRTKGDLVKGTNGVASGPVAFIKMVDSICNYITQGGVRRSTNMGILEVWHPDIEEFIKLKEVDGTLVNFNISVGIWEDFWKALENSEKYMLKNPKNNQKIREIDSNYLFELISHYAWHIADPGVLFFDNINKRNVLKSISNENIVITNPCGEEPLYPYESCNLASINLKMFLNENNEFMWDEYIDEIKFLAHFLDNCIDINNFPIPEIENETLKTRRIGVGMMGLAELFYMMKIRYNSKQGFDLMGKFAEYLTYYAMDESTELSENRFSFDDFDKSDYAKGDLPIEGFYNKSKWNLDWDKLVNKIKQKKLRNAMLTTCAPTGSIGMIADTSSGIEPTFSLVYKKSVSLGEFIYSNQVLEKRLKQTGIYSEKLLEKIANNFGSIQGIKEIPDELKDYFLTSMDIHYVDHILAQALLQKWITDSISKTINLRNNATVEDIRLCYLLAYKLGCKGITVYRDGSKFGQVLKSKGDTDKIPKITLSGYSKEIIDELKKQDNLVKRYMNTLDLRAIKVFKNSQETQNIEEENETKITGEIVKDIEKTEKLKSEINENKKSQTSNLSNKLYFDTNSINMNLNLKNLSKREIKKCPNCDSDLIPESGCVKCMSCGWTMCNSS